MTIFELATEVEALSGRIESARDILVILHEGLFNRYPEGDAQREVYCKRLHYYDAMLSMTTEAIQQIKKDALALSNLLYAINGVQKKADEDSAQLVALHRKAVAV